MRTVRVEIAPGRFRQEAVPDVCRHRGAEVGLVTCPTCPGADRDKTRVKTFACAVHHHCTLEKVVPGYYCCATCPHRAPPDDAPAAGGVRHLLFHVYPVGERWRWHAAEMGKRLGLFNGRRVLALALDARTAPAAEVRAAFGDGWTDVLEVANDPSLREVATFLPLFERVLGHAGPEDVTLYAHAKGAVREGHRAVAEWTTTLYETLLDHWPVVEGLLRSHPVAGSFRRDHAGWSGRESASQWHFSGSWLWFRNRDLFARPDWRRIDRFWSGIEPYPSLHFRQDQAGVVFYSWARPDPEGLYSDSWWEKDVRPKLEIWRREQAHTRTPAALFLPAPPDGLKIDLGGGQRPRAGFLNVDKANCRPDRRLDLETDDLPFESESVGFLYSAHCLEHVRNVGHVLREIVRVGKVGCRVELRVPHWLGTGALTPGHVHMITPETVKHWTELEVPRWFGGCPRRLRLLSTETTPGYGYERARQLHPGWGDDDLYRFVPGAGGEFVIHMEVIPNDL